MKKYLSLFALLICLPANATTWGPYASKVIRVIDGDTIEAIVMIWPKLRADVDVRLAGIDAPELHGKCDEEKKQAIEAAKYLTKLLAQAPLVYITVEGRGKYGRPIGTIKAGHIDVNQAMLDSGLARSYDGGPRQPWCKS